MSDKHKGQRVDIDLWDPVHFFAFGFGSGLSPFAPGTAGTLVAVPLYLMLVTLPLLAYVAVLCVVLAFGVWVCGQSANKIGVPDYSGIVWDEIAGYLLVMTIFVPTFSAVVVGFAAFRLFDILKPWPIRWIDKHVHGGIGIMLDDVLAAIFAAGLMASALLFFPDVISPYFQFRSQ